MKRRGWTVWAAGLAAGAGIAAAAGGGDTELLVRSYFLFRMASQVTGQAVELGKPAGGEAAAQVAAAAEEWGRARNDEIRAALEQRFGGNARATFGGFVSDYTAAETASDAKYLAGLARAAGWAPPPGDYAALREQMVQGPIAGDIASAGRFLGEIQTWLDVRSKAADAPPLRLWLDRGQSATSAAPAPPAPPGPQAVAPAGQDDGEARVVVPKGTFRPVNPLRDAEAPAGEYRAPEGEAAGTLDAFGAARGERRKKALDEAQAGMQQVAEERRAAEEEYAAKKTAAAQAEAEAVKKHAERLAAAEAEALEQRKNSWVGRLKQIASSAIGATSGAFLGGIGSRAGEAAAESVFKQR